VNTHKSTLALFIFLAIVGLAFIVLITSVRAPVPGSGGSSRAPTSTQIRSIYPGPDDPQTAAAIITLKAIGEATYLATTRTPFDTQVPFPTGTFEGSEVKFSGEKLILDALNAWGGYLNGNTVVIYAGSLLDHPEQGAIAILITLPYRNFSEKVLTPTKHGGVRVVAEQNNRLTLVANDGTIFYFDVPARQFVDSMDESVPTAALPPTYTPYAPPTETPTLMENAYPAPYSPGTLTPMYNPYPMPISPGTKAP